MGVDDEVALVLFEVEVVMPLLSIWGWLSVTDAVVVVVVILEVSALIVACVIVITTVLPSVDSSTIVACPLGSVNFMGLSLA